MHDSWLGMSVEACSFRFWKVKDEERAAMTIPLMTGFQDGRYEMPRVSGKGPRFP